MEDRIRFKRVNYFASNEFAEESVLKSWRNAIARQEHNFRFSKPSTGTGGEPILERNPTLEV